MRVLFGQALLFISVFWSSWLAAGCSPYIGQASLNEFSIDNPDYIEIRLIRDGITSAIYQDWDVRVCTDHNPVCYVRSLSSLESSSSATWLVVDATSIDFKDANDLRNDGFDAVLTDASGDVIDYLSVNGHNVQSESCDFVYDTDVNFNQNGTKVIKRDPDGFGDWDNETANNRETEGADNGGTTTSAAGFWRMDESSWSSSPGEVKDSSGNGFDAQAFQGVDTDDSFPAISGNPGTCRYGEFDGGGDYVQVPHNNALLGSNALTYVAWIQPDSWSGTRQVMAKSVHGGGSGRAQMGIFSESNNLRGRIETNRGRVNLNTSLPPTDGSWTHLALVFDGTSLVFYHNGIVAGSTTFSSRTLNQNTDALNIGKRVGTNQYLFNGSIDEVGVYTSALSAGEVAYVMNQTRPCGGGPVVDHYAISFNGADFSDGSGLTCEPHDVTIIAHDASNNALAPGAGVQISLSTSTGKGVWSNPNIGTLSNVGDNDGTATYTFDSNHTVTLQLQHADEAIASGTGAVNINTGADGVGEDPNIEFFDTGFRFLDASDNAIGSVTNPFIQEAGVESGTFYLQAVKTDDNTGACTGAFPDGVDKDIDLAAECIDPFTCAGEVVSLTNNGNTETIATNDGAPGYTEDLNIRFDANSKAAFTLNYPDVGAIQLHAKYDIVLENGSDSNVDMLGSSNSFVVKPYDLVVSNVPGNGVGLTGFVASGESFTVEVESRNAFGNRTPNFGLESAAESVELNFSSLEFPAGGVDGDFTSGNFSLTATAGRLQTTGASWDEVGTLKVFASIADGSYQGAGDVTGTPGEDIGRFYPDHFSLTGSVTNACTAGGTDFSYFSDPSIQVSYTAQAENVSDEVVENYDDALGFPVQGIVLVAESSDGGTDVAPGRLNVTSASWDDGVLAVTDGAASFLRSTLEAEMASLVVGVQADNTADDRDFDSPTMNAATSGDCSAAGNCDAVALNDSLRMRFGRLYTKDVHGPESTALPVILQAEYWNGSSWQLNTDDSCTSFGRALIEFNGNTIVSSLDVDFVGNSDADTTGTFIDLDASTMTLSGGDAGLVFTAPGAGKTGSFPVGVDTSGMDWLKFDWDQDGSHDDDLPTATVTFGSYRGHDRVIYWQERLAD
jgi:hypothetical protein